MRSTLLLVSAAACFVTSNAQLAGCQSSAECGSNSCCVLVEGRYATTSCAPLQRPGQQCRPPGHPLDLTLATPGGESVRVTGVHRALCPCRGGSACSPSGLCVAADSNIV